MTPFPLLPSLPLSIRQIVPPLNSKHAILNFHIPASGIRICLFVEGPYPASVAAAMLTL